MYNQLYLWANNNFKLLCICILVVVFAMVFISALMKHRRRMHICWISLFIVYLLMLAFITVISHSDIHQSVVVGRLRFHYIFIRYRFAMGGYSKCYSVYSYGSFLIWSCCRADSLVWMSHCNSSLQRSY